MSGLFKKPKTPKPEKPIPMPDMEIVERNKRRNAARRSASGRVSTILSDETLG